MWKCADARVLVCVAQAAAARLSPDAMGNDALGLISDISLARRYANRGAKSADGFIQG